MLEELGVERVDLLKVDCEGDELAVLRGISARHWAAIRQVVAEVHDINGRLDRVVALLRRHGFGGV
uniref:Methyltransferase FkbM domain-containing protein n=1 Tax=Emiliania huxleyi (strain CCMP1516) TaxID=280463 RepID=A0A0D3L0V8_EMIH1